jgi:hypothetical protein
LLHSKLYLRYGPMNSPKLYNWDPLTCVSLD